MLDDRCPNILFLFADQLQAFALGCMGHPMICTPNLDALAADGVLMRNAYSDSPSCGPFRGCLMTGKYPSESGVRRNEDGPRLDELCLAHRLNRVGYTTSYVGKWHLYATGNVPITPQQRCGFQRFIGYQAYNDFLNEVWFFDEQGVCHEYAQHRTAATTDLAIERLREIRDQRWAHFVSYQTPHYPLQPDIPFEALYAGRELPLRENVQPMEHAFTYTFSPLSPRPKERDPNYHRYGKSLADFWRCYAAMVTEFDHHVGRVIAELKRLGEYERTVIVVTSDHGEMGGSHGRMNKGVWQEESSRVPLIVRVPGGARGAVVDTPVSAGVDMLPTLVELAGAWAADLPTQGRSWAPLARSGEDAPHRPIFAEAPNQGDWLMVRDGTRKLVCDRAGRPQHAFDLASDPFEQHDLATDGQLPPEFAPLLAQLRQWADACGCQPSP